VRDYVSAAGAMRRAWSGRTFDRAAKAHGGGTSLIGTLARYRAILSNIDYGRASGQQRAIETFVTDHPDATLSYVLVQRASQYVSWNRAQQAADMWTTLAEKTTWKVAGLYSAGAALYRRGKYADAADLFQRSFETALAQGTAPIVDWQLRQGIQSGHGEASFRQLWNRWRTDVLAADEVGPRVAFVAAARALGEVDDAHRVVATTKAEHLEDVMGGVAMVDQLLAGNLIDDAWLITRRLLESAGGDGSVLDRAATVSELQGRIADAAGYLERAMKTEANAGVRLEDLRADYRRLIGFHTRLGRSQLDEARAQTHREQALRVAAQWRREDPDNAEIDLLCAALYVDEPARAWRHLSSIIERHPAQGQAYANVAQALAREGQLRRADELLERAIEVEPTDPTWRLRRAENLLALGDEPGARALLDEIAEGKWQDRFVNVGWQAENLRKQLER
jgi:tetratricopeptide (TPR) repeat protein